jgi:hypothetical protein
MKRWILLPLLLTAAPALAGNWFGSGPWANATYYPGNLDGKYQAAVSGVNTSGVLGFAIRDGSPPFLDVENQSTSDFSDAVAVNQTIEIDKSLNYYAIFVNGRTYVGTTAAGVNYDNNSVFGSLIGTQPTTLTNSNSVITSQLLTNVFTTNIVSTNITITNNPVTGAPVTNRLIVTNVVNQSNVETVTITNTVLEPVVIATGADGSFQASINGKRGVFTFQGPGQLTSPGPVISGQQANPTTAFNVNGIRTSFSSASAFQQVNSGATTGP